MSKALHFDEAFQCPDFAALHVPAGKPIPRGKLLATAKKKGRVGQEARFDLNVLSKGRKK